LRFQIAHRNVPLFCVSALLLLVAWHAADLLAVDI